MTETTIALLTRELARPASRRASLLAIGVPGLAAIAGHAPAAEGKKRKKRKKDKEKTCKRQVGQCNGFFGPLCQEEGAPEDCVEQTTACCELLGDCQADAFIDCLITLIRPPVT